MTLREDHDAFLHAAVGAMDLVYNLSRRFADRVQDTEDLAQETYLAAFRAWRDHRRPRRVEPWIATICLNLGRSRYRTKESRPIEVQTEDRDFPGSEGRAEPELTAEATMDREAMHQAMWRLPEEQRVPITLVDLAGLSTAEAARAMRTPRGTVLSRLHRGRRGLAALLWVEVRGVEER